MKIKILGIGDVVGKPGREIIRKRLPEYCVQENIAFVVANGENLFDGAGITPKDADILQAAGVHVITGGDHIWNRREIIPYIAKNPTILRPANYPKNQPGSGTTVVELPSGIKIGVLHLQGRVFMNVQCACPFMTAEEELKRLQLKTNVIVVDMHCEATSEKVAMGWWLDGKVSYMFGTHTHIPTADERVLPKGTAYITDVGMTGPYESVIGRRVDRVLHRMTTGMPARFDVATKDVRLYGAIATVDSDSGRAVKIERMVLTEDDH
jgi:metallophosphoesterase (TIGR00282 family)